MIRTRTLFLGVEKGEVMGEAEYARSNFWSCCITASRLKRSVCSQAGVATQPSQLQTLT